MAPSNFPANLDTLSNPEASNRLNSPPHAAQHTNANDALEAIEAKLGVDGSAVPSSIDYILKNVTAGHNHDGSNSRAVALPFSWAATTTVMDVGPAKTAGTSGSAARGDHVHGHPGGLGANLHHNESHTVNHVAGAADALSGNLDAIARVTVRVNSGSNTGSRRRLNLKAGAGIDITATDVSASEEVDVIITNTGGGGGGSVSFGPPTASVDIGDAQVEGTSGLATRADHQHAFPAPGAATTTTVVGTGKTEGTGTASARTDHRHDHGIGYLPDAHHPQSHGDADHSTGFAAPGAIVLGDTASVGGSASHTRADHRHSFTAPSPGYPVDVAALESDGASTTPARADHVHSHGSGYLPNAHHNASHNHAGTTEGNALIPASLILPPGAGPNTDGDVRWDVATDDLSVGTGSARVSMLPKNFVNTKGQLITRTDSAVSLLNVGTDTRFLKANSATPTGLEWGEHGQVIGTGDLHPEYLKEFMLPPYFLEGDVVLKTGKLRLYVNTAYVVVSVRASVDTPSSSGSIIVDVNKNGISIFNTRPTIVSGQNTNVSTSFSSSPMNLAAGDYLKFDIDSAGTGAKDLTIQVVLRRP